MTMPVKHWISNSKYSTSYFVSLEFMDLQRLHQSVITLLWFWYPIVFSGPCSGCAT